jgi:eukaryotic-like serine/threonine-protein kinase
MNERVVGNYKLLRELGSGAMGLVYEGVDVMVERPVAVKMLRAEIARQPDLIERFRVEATTLAKLNHPAIATLYSFFREGDDYYMVMEFVRGRTLEDVIRQSGRLPAQSAAEIMRQMLDGVAHAHRLGVLHRDIKPANIMINVEGQVKVTDFGIARVLGASRMTREGRIIGTLEYIAPERIRGDEADARSDLYSAGIVLYEMLSGRLPFLSETDFSLLQAHLNQPPPPMASVGVPCPPALEAIAMRAMAKAPADRFQNAEQFRDALAALLQAHAHATRSHALPPVPPVPGEMKPTRLADPNPAPPSIMAPTRLAPTQPQPYPMGATGYAAQPAFSMPQPAAPQSPPHAKAKSPVKWIAVAAGLAVALWGGVFAALHLRSGGDNPPKIATVSQPPPAAVGQTTATIQPPPVVVDQAVPATGQLQVDPTPITLGSGAGGSAPSSSLPTASPKPRQPASSLETPSSPPVSSPPVTAVAKPAVEPLPAAPAPAVEARPASPPPAAPPAATPSRGTPLRLRDVKRLYVERMPNDLDQYLREEIAHQLSGRLTVVHRRDEADAIMSAQAESSDDLGAKVTGGYLGMKSKNSAVARITDPARRALLWTGEAGDKAGITGIVKRGGGQKKLAERLVNSLRQALEQ